MHRVSLLERGSGDRRSGNGGLRHASIALLATAAWLAAVPSQAGMLERAVSAPGSHWGVSPDSSKDAIELTYRSDSSAPLSLHCGEVGCALFVEPRSGCSPGLVYPLLLNSSTQVGIAPSTCVRVSSRDASRATPRTGLLIGPDTEFVAGLFVGDSLSVAFPATAGGMEVLDVSAAGLPEAFASARE